MNNNRFSIFGAVKEAYAFVGREWLYLLKAGLLPMGMQIVTALFIQFQRPEASQIEGYLWGLPSTVLFAWFTFLEIRLLLLGERLDRLPQDRAYLGDRLQCMKVSIMMSVLFNMSMMAALVLLLALGGGADQTGGANWPATLGIIVIIGGIFWGVRFGLAPILAAVHHPIRPVLQQTWGMMFSLRLIAMGIVCLFPLAFLFQIFMEVLLPPSTGALPGTLTLTVTQQITLVTASAPFSLFIAALLNAAAASALKQILGSGRDGVLA